MKDEIVWLHLSDLHMYEKRWGWDSYQVLDELIKDLKRGQKDEGIRPDLIFFTGDVSFGQVRDQPGDTLADQYQKAQEFFDQVREAFSPEVAKANFFLVPGNHDVDRSQITPEVNEWLSGEDRKLDEILTDIHGPTPMWQKSMSRLLEYQRFPSARQ